jgi:hypothetical protein
MDRTLAGSFANIKNLVIGILLGLFAAYFIQAAQAHWPDDAISVDEIEDLCEELAKESEGPLLNAPQ